MFRIIVIMAALTVLKLNAKHLKMNLQEALEKKLVSGEARSRGAYKGYCVNLRLQSLVKDSLILMLEPGRRLGSADDKYQDILIVKREIISLKGYEEKSQIVKGYCCQSLKLSPPEHAIFSLNRLADSNLVALARFLDTGAYEQDTEQRAVWALSDGHQTAAIASANDSLLDPLRQVVARLKGEQLPWYTVLTSSYMYRSGTIVNFPILLKGKLEYTSAGEFATCTIINAEGLPVALIRREWLKAGSAAIYQLNVPVRGLPQGKYAVVLKGDQGLLVEREIEL